MAWLLLAAGFAAAWWLRRESLVSWELEGLRAQLDSVGAAAPVLFVAALAFRPLLLLPSSILLTVGGVLFGVLAGTALGILGVALGAVLAYTLARVLGRDAVARRLRGTLARADAHLARRGALWLAGWTAIPVTPLSPTYYAMGLSGIGPARFAGGVTAGLVPRCALFSFFGASLLESTRDLALASALILVALAATWVLRRRWGPRAGLRSRD